MALPPGITPKTVTVGIASFFDGSLAEGTATITAPVNVVHTPSNRPIFSSQMSHRFVDGETTFNLAPTDAPGLNRVDWTYKLNVVISGALVQPEPVYFILPAAGPDTIDLDGLVTVPSSAGTPISATVVTSVNGQTGDVVVEAGGGSVTDATTSAKGVVQLAGDLGGTAAAPTVLGLANKVNTSTYTAGLAAKANTADLAAVAQSGSYNDLANKPALAPVATSGVYADLTGKPTTPTRTAFLHLGGSGGQPVANGFTTLHLRVPIRVAQTTTRWRPWFSSEDLLANTVSPGSIALDGVWIGETALSNVGALTSATKAAPVKVMDAVTTPSDGSPHIGAWVTDTAKQLIAGREYLFIYSLTVPSTSQNVVRGSGWTWYKQSTTNLATDAQLTAPTSMSTLDASIMDVDIEYECVTDRPVVMVIGDSLSDGWRAGRGVHDAWGTIYGQATGTPVILNAYSGGLTSQFTTTSHRKYQRYAGLSLDAVFVALGTNDYMNSVTSATMQTNLGAIFAAIRATWGADIPLYATTMPPGGQAGGSGFENNRVAVNNWLRTMPYGLAGVVDFERVVRNPATLTALDPEFDYGDGLHLKVAGHRAEAMAVPTKLRRP